MTTMTPMIAMLPARMPESIESWPSDAPISRASATLSGTGNEPARSTSARSCAACRSRPPIVICPRAPIAL